MFDHSWRSAGCIEGPTGTIWSSESRDWTCSTTSPRVSNCPPPQTPTSVKRKVDARQINLTRFSIFFPEKRSFFLQDAGVFNFATTGIDPPGGIPGTGAEVFPFFSRKIGLLGGQEVPIDYGAKLTGKVGRTEIGMLDVRTRDVSTVDATNLFVGRVKQNFLEQSYVGAIFTEGNPASPFSSSTVGVDIRLATSDFLGSARNVVLNAYGLRSNNEGVSKNNSSYGFGAQYPNDKFAAQIL